MSSNDPVREPEKQWEQPRFEPGPAEPSYFTPSPHQAMTPFGAATVHVPPPTSLETTLSTLYRLIWPVALVLGIFTAVPFWSAIVGAILASIVLKQVRQDLRRRRLAAGPIPPDASGSTPPSTLR